MSGRALRKALRQRELAALSQKPEDTTEDEEAEDDAPPPQKQSLFALLGGEDEPEEQQEDEEEEEEEEEDTVVEKTVIPKQEAASTPSKKKKKKKKKGKSKSAPPVQEVSEDEIDAALRALNLQNKSSGEASGVRAEGDKRLSEILRVDPRNFDVAIEMRRLFGRAALDEAEEHGTGGRKKAPIPARGLGGRRNTFVQAKKEWPPAGSGGLGMETVSTTGDNVTEFKFVHSRSYQDVQRQFMMCVASMDPNRLIQLLQHNPYHVSTLLQASEIFAQQRDHTISGDLLERALFTFGRSLHSTFQSRISEGTARLSFLYPENREFWLCSWRYLRNLQMRGTWRTAAEFARLLLAMDPEGDPYQIRLCIDVIALNARQPEYLLALIAHPKFREMYANLPNMAYSITLAYKQLGQDALASEYLAKAMTKFPWVVTRLYAELNIDKDIPRVLWGALPPEGDKLQPLLSELYVTRSRDLWKGLEQLLKEVAGTIYTLPTNLLKPQKAGAQEIIEGVSLDVARHVLVTDIPSVTALLPREFTQREIPGYDPLPPPGDIRSYSVDIPDTAPGVVEGGDAVGTAGLFRALLRSFFPHLDHAAGQEPTEEEVLAALRERGIDVDPEELGLGFGGQDQDEERDGAEW